MARGSTPGTTEWAMAKSFAAKRTSRLLALIDEGPPLRQGQKDRLIRALQEVEVLPETDPEKISQPA
jgi:hypothetical protein